MRKVILPTDFVVGDIAVDEFGPLMGTELPQDGADGEGEKHERENTTDEVNHQGSDGGDTANVTSAATPAESDPEGTTGVATADEENDAIGATVDPEDEPAAGFEYEGEVGVS